MNNLESRDGFSIVELMIALVVLSVLVSLAIPSYTQILAEQRLRQASNELRMSVSLARSEAIKRNYATRLLPRTSGDWADGWCVKATTNAALTPVTVSNCSASGVSISDYALSDVVSMEGLNGVTSLSFNAWGRTTDNPSFQIGTIAGDKTCTICVSVSNSGDVVSSPGACPAGSDDESCS
ncbi:GspH/FimT family pseudopilin [bacterium]|nr:GspH/FimT family pseudopilin [bacterium]